MIEGVIRDKRRKKDDARRVPPVTAYFVVPPPFLYQHRPDDPPRPVRKIIEGPRLAAPILATVPVIPVTNVGGLTRPFLQRIPDADRRTGRVSDTLSAIVNSLAGQGQLVQTAPQEYSLVPYANAMHLEPRGTPPTADPGRGIFWMDTTGRLHYLSPAGVDTVLTP